jgi:hypothetical protein
VGLFPLTNTESHLSLFEEVTQITLLTVSTWFRSEADSHLLVGAYIVLS